MAQTGFAVVNSAEELASVLAKSNNLAVMQEGQQSELMFRYESEIFIGGEKGSGKSAASIVWLIRGNLDVPDDKKDQIDLFYFNCPVYRCAVVRKNIDDLNDWVESAKRVYGTEGDLLGATYTKQPREFTWPSGAKLICSHMSEADAYQRLTGQSLTRLFWDEVTFEPDKDVYEKVYSSVRSTHKKMRAQVLVAGNPEGPGLPWVKERFVRYTDPKGRAYKPGEVMQIPVYDPITKTNKTVTRLFLHWRLAQNKVLLENDPLYAARLSSLSNPSLRRAYLFGDFDAAGGKFFEFRRTRREEEPPNACHTYDAETTVIQPWWPRLIGMDVGYSHYCCAIKIALSPDGRAWVTDELAHKGIGSVEWGAILARWCVPDMAGLRACGAPTIIPVFISPDAIEQRRDAYGTWAEHIRDGIISVYGNGASEILASEDAGTDDFDDRRVLQYESKMPLRRAMNKRVDGWNIMRGLMEWTSVAEPDLKQYSQEYADKLAARDAHEYFDYQKQFMKKPEALPKMQLSSRLRYLPDALESAVSSDRDLEDVASAKRGNKDIVQLHDDMRDASRYGFAATLLFKRITTPVEVRVQSVLSQYPGITPEQRFHATPMLTKSFEKKTVKGFRVGRGANAGVYIS